MLKKLCAFAVVMTAMCGGASADDLTGTLKKIKDTGVITVGNRDSSVPFSYLEGLPHFVWRSDNWMGIIRALRSSAPARPYIARLIVFSRLI